ncbi:MAG: RagB/SusD family nutrient uptake outer membrane protein [Bacteroidaceae bacterium]
MKYIYITILIVCSLMVFNSCVDLDQEPKSFLTEEEYIELPQDINTVELAATGLYHSFWDSNYGFCCRMFRFECAADQLVSSPKPNNVLENMVTLNPDAGANGKTSSAMWANMWNVITGANKLIVGTPVPKDEAEAKKYKSVLAEAHFMRGLSYFYLVRLFGDVPAITKPSEATKPQERVAVETIYNDIIVPDALYAAEYLPTTSRSGFSSTPSQWAGKTFLANVYLTMAGWPLKLGQSYYQKAADTTLDIINNSNLSLTDSYEGLWKEIRKEEANEHLFALHNSVDQRVASQYGKSFYPRDYKLAGWADYYANPDYMGKYPEGARKDFVYMTSWSTKGGVINWKESLDGLPCIAKYQDYNQGPAGKSQLSNGITPIFRYAEVLLIYAEASNLATGTVNSKALQCLQQIQRRAGIEEAKITTTTDSNTFDTAVFNERGYEFIAEYRRWFDLVRREKLAEVKPVYYIKSVFKENNHYYFPIDLNDISMTSWKNNPGY